VKVNETPQDAEKSERIPWFGPRSNDGYRPQTWQGAIFAMAVVLVSVVASSKGHVPPEALLAIPIIAIPAVIRWRHRR
jgi:hypothetical protein